MRKGLVSPLLSDVSSGADRTALHTETSVLSVGTVTVRWGDPTRVTLLCTDNETLTLGGGVPAESQLIPQSGDALFPSESRPLRN